MITEHQRELKSLNTFRTPQVARWTIGVLCTRRQKTYCGLLDKTIMKIIDP